MQKELVQFQMPISKVEVRSDDNSIIIEWMASTPEIDRYNSIITPDSIRNGMENYLKIPVILLWHNSNKPIGSMIDHRADNLGLYIQAKLTQDIDNIFQSIRDGVTKGFSIGFYPLERSYEDKNWVLISALTQEQLDQLDYNDIIRKITKIELVEISVVSIPANPSAMFTLSKAVRKFFDNYEKRSVIQWLSTRQVDEVEVVEQEVTEEVVEEIAETTQEITDEVEKPKDGEWKAEDDEETQDNQGDEVEASGETPQPVQQEDNDPTPEVETPSEQLPTEVEVPSATPEANEERSVLDLFDEAMELIELQAKEINNLKSIVNKIPARRWLVTVNGQKKEDPLLADLRKAKEAALGSI